MIYLIIKLKLNHINSLKTILLLKNALFIWVFTKNKPLSQTNYSQENIFVKKAFIQIKTQKNLHSIFEKSSISMNIFINKKRISSKNSGKDYALWWIRMEKLAGDKK